jgi:hypothetical protein
MKRYNVRVDYIVDADTEDEAFDLYMTGKATYDAVYEVEEIHDYDDDIDDEEDEA